MIISWTPLQYMQSTAVQQIVGMLVCNSTGTKWNGSYTTGYIDTAGQAYVTQDMVNLCRAEGLQVTGAWLYSSVFPETTLDNKVDASWPGALKSVEQEDGTIKEETKEIQEYFRTHEVEGGYIALLAGPLTNGNIFDFPDNDLLWEYVDKFGGFLTKSEGAALIAAAVPVAAIE